MTLQQTTLTGCLKPQGRYLLNSNKPWNRFVLVLTEKQPRSVFRMRNPLQNYAWGSTTAIPELLGIPPTDEPQAEMWLGAHPEAPSFLPEVGSTLDAHLAAHPYHLGEALTGYEGQLPFLMKLLAVERPLSIQVHPTREQAQKGFHREDLLGIPLNDPRRSFRDHNHKPEMLLAMTTFEALAGFRNPADSGPDLAALFEGRTDGLRGVLVRHLAAPDAAQALKSALHSILTSGDEARELARDVVAHANQAPDAHPLYELISRVADAHGAEPGVLAVPLLNHLRLQPGEAIFLDAGLIHAYVSGLGVEAMAPSNNVLRGGLTTKHIDVPHLFEVVRYEPTLPTVVQPEVEAADGVRVRSYCPPVPEFSVHEINLTEGTHQWRSRMGPAVLVTTEGSLDVSCGTGSATVAQGESVFLSADSPTLVASRGRARAYLTTVGRHGTSTSA